MKIENFQKKEMISFDHEGRTKFSGSSRVTFSRRISDGRSCRWRQDESRTKLGSECKWKAVRTTAADAPAIPGVHQKKNAGCKCKRGCSCCFASRAEANSPASEPQPTNKSALVANFHLSNRRVNRRLPAIRSASITQPPLRTLDSFHIHQPSDRIHISAGGFISFICPPHFGTSNRSQPTSLLPRLLHRHRHGRSEFFDSCCCYGIQNTESSAPPGQATSHRKAHSRRPHQERRRHCVRRPFQ